MVPLFSQFFIMPGNTQLTPFTVIGGFTYLVWTFSTEIPFLIIFGPPILQACHRAFPSLKTSRKVTNGAGKG
jgi:nitrate reductase NapE component